MENITTKLNGRCYPVTGRVVAMILCLARRRAGFNSLAKGKVEFNSAGRSLKVGLHEVVEVNIEK